MNEIILGGPRFMWPGQLLRRIRIDEIMYAVLPKRESFVSIGLELDRNHNYGIVVCAKTNIDCNIIVEFIGENKKVQSNIISIGPAGFSEYKSDFILAGKGKEKITINIKRLGNTQCEVMLKEVRIKENTSYLPVVAKKIKETLDTSKVAKQIEAGKAQNKVEKDDRSKRLGQILSSRNSGMATIGGNKYKWQGKNIKILYKDGVQCVDLANKDSCVYARVNVLSDSSYKILVVAEKIGGDGNILLNFFGGKNVDGSPVNIRVQDNIFRDHAVIVNTPKFSPGSQIYLRIWRNAFSAGQVIIKSIQYIKTEKHQKPGLIKIKDNKVIPTEKKKSKKNKIYKKMVEDFNMKFKPYNKSNNLSKQVNAVLVQKDSDVPKISIITPTRNGLTLIQKCYNAIANNTNYPNWEWIVGDSLSNDGTVEFLRQKQSEDKRIKIIERGTTDGSFSSINNELVKCSDGEYVLFLNNDTEPQPFWLYNMISKIHRNSEVGIVGSKLCYSKDKIQHCGIAFIQQGPANIGKSVLKSFPSNFSEYDRQYQAVTAACMLMRRSDFDAVGGFGEEYWFCYEDVDLCLKIKNQLNKKIVYSSGSVVIHNESVTQNKYKTSGPKQQEGIKTFKQKWMSKVELDFTRFQSNNLKGLRKPELSFITCVNNVPQYFKCVVGSLFKNNTIRNYEIVPVLNHNNEYSAAQALNIGLCKSKADIVVFCHQDVLFYENWIETLFKRIEEVERRDKNWGILGTAGITTRDDTYGVVYSLKGKVQWQQTKRSTIGEVQTVDEHCMIMRRSSKLKFDEALAGFHLYGPDICLYSISKGMKNYGILNPLVHESSSSSLFSGQKEFMKWLNFINGKWGSRFKIIRTPTSIIKKGIPRTFIKFG